MTVKEIRIALTVQDWEKSIQFFRDGLGLKQGELWMDGGRGQLFLAGSGTLEIFDPDYAAFVDDIEVGKRVSGQVRLAFEVDDLTKVLARALKYGAKLVNEPVRTPWMDLNTRIQSPEGIQITLFQRSQE